MARPGTEGDRVVADPARWSRRTALLGLAAAGCMVLMFADLVGSAAVRELGRRRAEHATLEAEVLQEPYAGTSWGRRYWQELASYRERWEPYYVYRVGDLHGEFINVTDGVRATFTPRADTGRHRHRILVFGGSAAWGHGARDDYTIPSWLARLASEDGELLDVCNCAESGWVNWQGVVYLLQLLADGERPDAVIFYSGVNEVLSGRQWPQVRRPIWDAELPPRGLGDWAMELNRPLRRTWDFYRSTSLLWGYLFPRPSSLPPAPSMSPGELTDRIAKDYLTDEAVVERLGHAYNFTTLFIWQAVVSDKSTLSAQERRYVGWLPRSADEQALGWWAMDADLQQLYGEIGARGAANGPVTRFQSPFDGMSATAFIDWMHTSELGNERIARLLYGQLSPRLHQTGGE